MITNEPFYVDDKFYSDIDDYINDVIDDYDTEEDISDLPETWSEEAEETKLRKICTLKKSDIEGIIIDYIYDTYNDMMPEDGDIIEDQIKQAVNSGIDIDKINNLLPELYCPSGVKFTITKKDLIDYI